MDLDIELKNRLEKVARPFYENERNKDPSHDWSHVLRVESLALSFSKELGANNRVLIPAVYLHDLINIPKDSVHRSKASEYSAQKTKEVLKSFSEFNDEEVNHIAQVVLEHSYSRNLSPTSLESEILQDADKLDGMGAIGVMRWASVGTKMNASFYHIEDPYGENRELDDRSYGLDHFPKKLNILQSRLNTIPGKREGERRQRFFNHFLKEFQQDCQL